MRVWIRKYTFGFGISLLLLSVMLFGLGVDPGETNFGMSLVVFDPRRVTRRLQRQQPASSPSPSKSRHPRLLDTDFEVRWLALWDIKAAGGGSGTLESEVHAISQLVHETRVLQHLLGDRRLVIMIETQEGGDWRQNPALAQELMRTSALSAAFAAIFLEYGHVVEFVGKKSRWGWTSYMQTADYARLDQRSRRARNKACITLYVRDLVQRQQLALLQAPLREDEPHDEYFYWRLASNQVLAMVCGRGVSFDESAHCSDAVVMAMFGLRRMVQPSVRHKNVIDAETWPQIAEQAVARVPSWSGNQRRPVAAPTPTPTPTPTPGPRQAAWRKKKAHSKRMTRRW